MKCRSLQCLVSCSICEMRFPEEELKEADDLDPQGNHRYLSICEECEDTLGRGHRMNPYANPWA
jgi:hypothetical protein